MKHLFYLYGKFFLIISNFERFYLEFLDADRDGSITPLDFEILAKKLSSLIGQDDPKREEEYATARKTLCQEIMRADANQDGKVTLGEKKQHLLIFRIFKVFCRRMAQLSRKSRC